MEYKLQILINKINQQIENHKREMDKKNNQFDFFEGRKIEAEVILRWIIDSHYDTDTNTARGDN